MFAPHSGRIGVIVQQFHYCMPVDPGRYIRSSKDFPSEVFERLRRSLASEIAKARRNRRRECFPGK
jgi:hypothetical protein